MDDKEDSLGDDLKQEYIEDNQDFTDNEEVDDELSKLQDLNKELENKYLTTHADFANQKKRLEKEKSDAIAYSIQSFARDLLSVVDALELSLKTEDENAQDLKSGIELTLGNFKKVFSTYGIEEISSDGEFNPNFHEAIMKVDSEEKNSGEIVEVLQKGYKLKDRVLRASMVSVAK